MQSDAGSIRTCQYPDSRSSWSLPRVHGLVQLFLCVRRMAQCSFAGTTESLKSFNIAFEILIQRGAGGIHGSPLSKTPL